MRAASKINSNRPTELITQALKTEEELGFLSSYKVSAKAAGEPRTSGAMKYLPFIKSFFSRTCERAITLFNSEAKQEMYARHAIADFSRELGTVLENLKSSYGTKANCPDLEQWLGLQASYQKAYGRCASEEMLGQVMNKHLRRYSAGQEGELSKYLEQVKNSDAPRIIGKLREEMNSHISKGKEATIKLLFLQAKMPYGAPCMGDPNIAKAYLDTLKIYGGMSDLKISQDFGEKWLSLNIREQLLLLEFCMHDEQFFARCESLLAQFLKADVMQEKWWHAGTVNRGILVSAGLEAKFKSGVDVREKKAEEQEKQQKRRLISDFGAAINACFEEKDGVKLNEAASAFMKKVGDCTSQEINVQELLQNHLKSLPPVSKVRVLYLINSVAQSQGKIGIQFAVSPAIENLVKMVRSEEALLTLKPEDLTDQELKIFIQIVGEDEISHENLRKIQDSLRLEASKRASVKSTREIYINNHGARKSLVYGLSYGTFMRTLSGVLNLSRYIDQQMRVSDGNSEKPSTEELIERLILGFAPEELQELMHSNNLHRLAGIIEALANANDDKTVRAHEVAKALYSTLTKNNVEKPASITVSPEKFDSARHAVTFVFGLSDSGNHPSIQQRLSMANDWVEAFDIMAGPPVPAPSSADGLKEEEFARFSLDFPRIQVFLDVMPLTIQGYNDPMESLQEAYAKIMTLTDGNTAQAGGVLRVLTQLMGNALQGELEKSPLFQLSERSIAKAEGVRLGGSSLSPSNPDSVFRIRKSEDGTIIIKMLLLNEQVEKAFDIRSGKFVVFDAALSSAFIETGIGVNKIGEVFSEGFVKGMLVGTATAIVGGSEAEERKDHLKTKNNADSQSQGKLTEKRVVVQDLDRRRVGELQRYA